LRASIRQRPRVDSGVMPNAAPEENSNRFTSPQRGLLGRLLALNAEQSQGA
jgi:hypothetical protein